MFLARLRLRNFRNFTEQVLEFPPGGAAIVGDNGQGKTNLLEAIYYLEIFRSFRGSRDEQLVRFGQDVFRVDGRVMDSEGTIRELAAAFDRRGRKKKVTVGGLEPPRLGEAIGGVGAVIFSPSDVQVVSGSPGGRRRFLDIVLSLAVPGYLETLQSYRQSLLNRNALLRQGARRSLIAAWDEGLIARGSRIIAARARWVAERRESFAGHAAVISGGREARLDYLPSVRGWQGEADDPSTSAIAEAFRGELGHSAEREQRRGITVVGPHRDDLRISVAGDSSDSRLDLRIYGSGGQQRTAAVALRMTEADTIRETRERNPVILLDDVFAELDPGRTRRILDWVEQDVAGQVILTAPKPADFELRGGSLPQWRIRSGRIEVL